MSNFNGTVYIDGGKIVEIKILDGEKELTDIQQLLALKTLVEQHILAFEKDYKRS